MSTISALGADSFLHLNKMKEMMMKGNEADKETLANLEDVALKPPAVTAKVPSKNMMTNNFVSSGSVEDDQSKYMKARHAGQEAVRTQANRQNAVLNAAMTQATGDSYAARILAGKKAARSVMDEMKQSTLEACERNLADQKKAAEETNSPTPVGTTQTKDGEIQAVASAPERAAPTPEAPSVDIVV